MEDHHLQLVARFVYKHRKNVVHWTSPILLEHPEVSSLNLSIPEAGDLFRALYEKGFLRIDGLGTAKILGNDHQIYQVDRVHLSAFREFASFPCYYKFLPDSWVYLLDRWRNAIFVCILLVLTAFLQGFTKDISGRFSDWVWPPPKVISEPSNDKTDETKKEEQDAAHQSSEPPISEVIVDKEVESEIEDGLSSEDE